MMRPCPRRCRRWMTALTTPRRATARWRRGGVASQQRHLPANAHFAVAELRARWMDLCRTACLPTLPRRRPPQGPHRGWRHARMLPRNLTLAVPPNGPWAWGPAPLGTARRSNCPLPPCSGRTPRPEPRPFRPLLALVTHRPPPGPALLPPRRPRTPLLPALPGRRPRQPDLSPDRKSVGSPPGSPTDSAVARRKMMTGRRQMITRT